MEKERKVKTLSIAALIVAVLGLTVAFAALSTQLTINGTAEVKAATWDIHFANLSEATLTGTATVATAPTLTATKIGDYKITIVKPGDGVKYTFDVENKGTIDAKLGTFTKPEPVCTSAGTAEGSAAEAAKVCEGLTYTLTYTDTGSAVAAEDTLAKGETKNLTLTLSYDSDSVPSNDVEISGLDITMVYNQN